MPPPEKYYRFEIAIERRGDRYWTQVISSPTGQSEEFFDLPFTSEELSALMLGATDDTFAGMPAQLAGIRLFNALFHGGIGLRSSLARVGSDGLRINLRLNDTPELAILPWEILYDPTHGRFLALSERTPIARYLALPMPEALRVVTRPLRILVLLSDPLDFGLSLNVKLEWEKIQQALTGLEGEREVVLERLNRATWSALQDYLREHEVHILHFMGHGFFDTIVKEGGILFEDDQQQSNFVSATQFAILLHNHSSLRLVVLNACETATSQADIFAGVAQSLVRQGIPAVIAMQRAISDAAAITFGREFYSAIADSYPVDAALTQARIAVYAASSLEWIIPVLFMRAPDGLLFEIASSRDEDAHWHPFGSVWLGIGTVGLALLVGLGHLLLQENKLLLGSIAAVTALLTFLATFFGIKGDKTFFPRLSHRINRTRLGQPAMGAIFVLSLVLWGVVGLPYIKNKACEPFCKLPGEQWFAIDEWKPPNETLMPAEQLLVQSTRRVLYTKLAQVKELKGFNIESPQIDETIKQRLDFWIEGNYQKLDVARLSA